MNPFVLIELIVFVAAESSIVLERDATHDASTLAIALVGVACFAGLRFALPWAQRSRRRTNAFFVAEMLLLATIAIDQMSAALIITSTSVCIRSAELVRPVRDATSYSAVTLAVVLAAMTYWARTGGVSWPTVGGWIVSMLLAWGLLGVLVTFAANERRINEELRAAQREAIAYARKAETLASERERARIALQLHNAVGHGLTALNVQLETALRLRNDDPVRADAFVRSAKALGSGVLRDVRETVACMRSDDASLALPPIEPAPIALERVCERYEQDFALPVRRTIANVDAPAPVTTAFLRIAEEALTNVVRHAHAAGATLALAREDGAIALTIDDDGRGFDPSRGDGQGIAIMRERARDAGLAFEVASTEHGTRVRVAWSPAT